MCMQAATKSIHCGSPARKLHKPHDGRTIKVSHLPLPHFAPTLTHHVQAHLWHRSEGFMLLSTRSISRHCNGWWGEASYHAV